MGRLRAEYLPTHQRHLARDYYQGIWTFLQPVLQPSCESVNVIGSVGQGEGDDQKRRT
jgi:hypothetical protein